MVDAKSAARALHPKAKPPVSHTQHQRRRKHALISHQGGLRFWRTAGAHHQADEAINWEVGAALAENRLICKRAQPEFDQLAMLDEQCALDGRQCGDQPVGE